MCNLHHNHSLYSGKPEPINMVPIKNIIIILISYMSYIWPRNFINEFIAVILISLYQNITLPLDEILKAVKLLLHNIQRNKLSYPQKYIY